MVAAIHRRALSLSGVLTGLLLLGACDAETTASELEPRLASAATANRTPITIELDYPVDLTENEIWVGVLSTPSFDATKIDPASVTLVNGAGKSAKRHRAGTEDLNRDGLDDARFSFKVKEVTAQGVMVTPADVVMMLGRAKPIGDFVGSVDPSRAPQPHAFQLTVTPTAVTLAAPGATAQLSAAILNRKGKPVPGLKPEWKSLDPTIVEVDSGGKITARAPGTGKVRASWMGLEAPVDVTVPTPPPPLGSGDFVDFPTPELEFILGPQTRSGRGSGINPWPWFDEVAISNGVHFGSRFPAVPESTDWYILENYYDQGMVQYTNFYRTGDVRFRDYARKIADSWWLHGGLLSRSGTYDDVFPPRTASLGGVILRALDGRPEMWPGITGYVRAMYDIWLGLRLNNPELHHGIRDGGYMLLYTAWLARVHPDLSVRSEMRTKALNAAVGYYARLQYADGSWRWREDSPNDPGGYFTQPLMMGLLLEGMIATHRLTDDPRLQTAIVNAADNLYNAGYRTDSFDLNGDGTMDGKWRGMWYFVYGTRCSPPIPGSCGEASPVREGDSNVIREVRQLNPLTIHAFGYAYKLTGDPKYRTWGDEIFSATFGNGRGPGADSWSSLAGWGERGREYNQSFRSAGRYLAWRAGR